MHLETLSKKQIKRIYRQHLTKDFPKSETKPLFAILRAVNTGIYECFGLLREDELLGYAFLVKQGENYLIDYLATVRGKRSRGIGSDFLRLLGERLGNAEYIIAEVEDPVYAKSSEDAELQTRRLDFYKRNGFADTTLKANTFGVDFIIIEMPISRTHSAEDIKELYKKFYNSMLPERIYLKAVKIRE